MEMVGGKGEGVQPYVAGVLLDGSCQHASHHLVHLRAGTQQQPSLEAPGRDEVWNILSGQPIPIPLRTSRHAGCTLWASSKSLERLEKRSVTRPRPSLVLAPFRVSKVSFRHLALYESSDTPAGHPWTPLLDTPAAVPGLRLGMPRSRGSLEAGGLLGALPPLLHPATHLAGSRCSSSLTPSPTPSPPGLMAP
jgi:hypothetical protein